MTNSRHDNPPCPHCGAMLATAMSRQCFSCGWDWHDSNQPVQRGNPNWNRFGLDARRMYVVELCQEATGYRYTKYRDVENGTPDPHAILETVPATGQEFIDWGQYTYADFLQLTNGEPFAFDAHGIWLSHGEIQRMRDRSNPWWQGDQSFWVNGIMPLFPPK